MLRKVLVSVLILTLALTGCSNIEDKISEDEAKELVIEKRSGNVGRVEILSIEKKRDSYIIEWINEENMEKGIDEVDKNKEIKDLELEIE